MTPSLSFLCLLSAFLTCVTTVAAEPEHQHLRGGVENEEPSAIGNVQNQHFASSRRYSSEPLFEVREHEQRSRRRRAQGVVTYIVDGELTVPFEASAFDVVKFGERTPTNDVTVGQCFPGQPLEAKSIVGVDATCQQVHNCAVGPTDTREWLGYMFNLPEEEDETRFEITVRAASSTSGDGLVRRFRVEIGNEDGFIEKSDDFLVPATGLYQNYTFTPMFSAAGVYLLKVTFLSPSIDMCMLTASLSSLPTVALGTGVLTIPATAIAIKDWVGFAETNPNHIGNCGLDLRTPVDGFLVPTADACATRDGATCAVAFTQAGEFIDYQFESPAIVSGREYNLRIRASAGPPSGIANPRLRVVVNVVGVTPQDSTLALPAGDIYDDIVVPLTIPSNVIVNVRLQFLDDGIRVCSLRLDAITPAQLTLASVPAVPAIYAAIDYVGYRLRDPQVPRGKSPSCVAVPGPMEVGSETDNNCEAPCYLTGTRKDDVLEYVFRTTSESVQITIRMSSPTNRDDKDLLVSIDENIESAEVFEGPQLGTENFVNVVATFDDIDTDLPLHVLRLQLLARNVFICGLAIAEA